MSDHEVDAIVVMFLSLMFCAVVVAILAPAALSVFLRPLVDALEHLIDVLTPKPPQNRL